MSDVLLPERLTVSAEVKDFNVPATYTVALSDLLSETDMEQITGINEIQNALDDLEDAAIKLVGGSSELSDGASTFSQGVDSYTEGMDEISRAVSTYLGEGGELSRKVTEYVDGVDTVTLGIQNYIDGTESLADGVTSYVNGETRLAEGAEQLTDLSRGLAQVQSALAELETLTDGKTDNDGGKDLVVAAQNLADGMEKLKNICGSDTVEELVNQIESMTQIGQELLAKTKELDEAAQQNLMQPVQNIATQLNTLSGEVENMSNCKENLEFACSQINEVISTDNQKIANAKEKGRAINESVNESVSTLEAQKEEIASTDPVAAQELDDAIETLKTAGESVETLQTLEELDPLQTGNLGIDLVNTETVRQAAEEISVNMASFSSAAETLNEQLPVIQNKLEDLEQKADSLPEGSAEEFMQQIALLSTGMQQFNDAIGGKNGLSENIAILSQSADTFFPEAVEGLEALNSGFDSLSMYNSSLLDGAANLKETGKVLSDGTETLKVGTGVLVSGFGTLGSQLGRGTALLSENSGQMRDGAASLKDGATALSDSMKLFEKDGTGKLQCTIEDQLGTMIDRLKALDSDEAAYDTFGGKEESMDGTVKFIIETEAIE